MALAPNPMPQPDAMFYGVALRDGTPLASGTLTAILPRGDTVTAHIAPITGHAVQLRTARSRCLL